MAKIDFENKQGLKAMLRPFLTHSCCPFSALTRKERERGSVPREREEREKEEKKKEDQRS